MFCLAVVTPPPAPHPVPIISLSYCAEYSRFLSILITCCEYDCVIRHCALSIYIDNFLKVVVCVYICVCTYICIFDIS